MKKIAAGVLALTAVGLAGCFSIFPKAEPAQLYRFGTSIEASAGTAGTVPLAMTPVEFSRAAMGDRILTVTGSEVAYIAASRWAAPAEAMFRESLDQAFLRNARVVNLVERRESRAAALMLDVDVTAFEARYENGREAAPTAVVAINARLIKLPERTSVAQKTIEARRPASGNRVSLIVEALDGANNDALIQLVQWADQNAR